MSLGTRTRHSALGTSNCTVRNFVHRVRVVESVLQDNPNSACKVADIQLSMPFYSLIMGKSLMMALRSYARWGCNESKHHVWVEFQIV